MRSTGPRAYRDASDLFALTPRLGSWLLCIWGKGMAVWNGEELLRIATIFLAWASLVALWIAWDAHVKFRNLVDTPRPGELGMSHTWERRSHRWRGIGLVTFGASILFFVASTAARLVR